MFPFIAHYIVILRKIINVGAIYGMGINRD